MTITLEIAPDLEQDLQDIPDFNNRLNLFIQDQIKLEKRRKEGGGFSAKTLSILAESARLAETDKKSGITRKEAFATLQEVHSQITQQL
jgi:hypothetical protein